MYDLPKEIRDLIFEYALANDSVPSKDSDNGFRRNMRVYIPKANSACSLLQTCKAVYLEAYRLPMQVNGTQPFPVLHVRVRALRLHTFLIF